MPEVYGDVYSSPLNNYGNNGEVGSVNVNGQVLSQNDYDTLYGALANDTPESALQWLKDNNPELYAQLILERDNNRLEWERYADYQRNYYSLQKESLEKAGMNPWLALQNFGSIGTGSVANIQGMNSGSSTLKAQREAKQYELGGKAIGAAAGIIGSIIGILIMAML